MAYYDVDSIRDVADKLMWSGYYGRIPTAIRWYINYDKMIADLEEAGWYVQGDVRVAVLPMS